MMYECTIVFDLGRPTPEAYNALAEAYNLPLLGEVFLIDLASDEEDKMRHEVAAHFGYPVISFYAEPVEG